MINGSSVVSEIIVHSSVPQLLKYSTVKPRFRDTRLMGTPLYNGQFALSLGKESLTSFL